MGPFVCAAIGLVDLTEFHLPDRLGGALGIALAEHQHILMGAAQLARRLELPPGADRQRPYGSDKDSIVVEPGTRGLECLDRSTGQVDKEPTRVADIADHPDSETVVAQAGNRPGDNPGVGIEERILALGRQVGWSVGVDFEVPIGWATEDQISIDLCC